MKFCLLNNDPDHTNHGKVYTVEQNHMNNWATIMDGIIYSGPLFDQGEYGLDYDYFNQFDLIMVGLRQETIEAGIKVKQRSKAKVVVFLDGEVEHFTTHISRDLQAKMVELLNIVDAVAVLHDESIPLFKTLTSKPVGLVGLPFPLRRVRQMCPPVQKRNEIELGSIIEAGLIRNRDGLVNLAALSEIGIAGVVDLKDPVEMQYVESVRKYVKLPQIRFRHNVSGWDHYMAQANHSLLGLHLDYRCTWGKLPIECAAVRMPCVAPSSFYTQKILFPSLCVPYHDIEGVVALVKKLVSDVKFYEEVVAYAESQLDFFEYEKTKKRLFNLFK